MKANELRIGNLVWNDTQKIVVPVDLKILSEQVYRYGKLDNDYLWTPIPLTNDFMINKASFKKVATKKADGYYLIKRIGYSRALVFKPNLEEVQELETGLLYNCFIQTICLPTMVVALLNVDYVHQLQNLYFALTGEELTIKP